MNLIERQTNPSIISSYRSMQYNMIQDFILNGMNYLIKLGLPYDPNVYKTDGSTIQYISDHVYSNIKHFNCTQVKIKIEDTGKKLDNFLYTTIPNLIEGIFFKLNGVYYIPMLYISDEPIVLKERSISLYSLFQPMTLYFGQKRVIFMGISFKLEDFLQIITHNWNKEDIELIENDLELSLQDRSLESNLIYFGEKLNCNPDVISVKNRLNDLFFDDWTAALYHEYYKINPDINEVFLLAVHRKVKNIKPSFIDLRYKRITFMEQLLKPIFKNISFVANRIIRGFVIKDLRVPLGGIVQHFFKELNGNVLYDTTNGFSGILAHKASFKNPFGQSELPREVSSIHWTHRNRICPNSITNKDPGQNVLLVPDQQIDLKYGMFHFTKEEMERE